MSVLIVNSRSERGFTLVELLLAMTLISMLLALAYGGLRAATQAAERGQKLLEVTGGIRSSHQFVRRQLNQLQPLPFELIEEDNVRVVFLGDSRRIQYVAPMPGYLGQGGPQVQVLELVPGAEGDQLLFSHALLQDFTIERLLDRDPIVLLDNIASGEFQFLSRDEEGNLMGWEATWTQPDQLPVAVSLDLALNSDSPALWPPLMAGVRVDESAVSIGGGRAGYQDVIRDLVENPNGDER